MKKIFRSSLLFCGFFVAAFAPNAFSQPQWMYFTSSDYLHQFEVVGEKIWVAASGGLTKIDLSTGENTNYNEGFPNFWKNDVQTIGPAEDGSVWMSGYEMPISVLLPDETISVFEKTQHGEYVWDAETIFGIDSENAFFYGSCGFSDTSRGWWALQKGIFSRIYRPLGTEFFWGESKSAILDKDHALWMSWETAIAKWDGSKWTVFDAAFFGGDFRFYALAEDKNGAIWAAGNPKNSFEAVLFRIENGQTQRIDGPVGEKILFSNAARPLFFDETGGLHLLSEWENELWKYDASGWSKRSLTDLGGLPEGIDIWANSLDFDSKGTLWAIGGSWSEHLYSLEKGQNQFKKQENLGNSGLSTNNLSQIVIGKDNTKNLFGGKKMMQFDGVDWSEKALSFLTDSSRFWVVGKTPTDGAIWFFHETEGADFFSKQTFFVRFDGQNFQAFKISPTSGDLPFWVSKAVIDSDGTIWFSSGHELWKMSVSGQVSQETNLPTTANLEDIQDFFVREDGQIWLLTEKTMCQKSASGWKSEPLEPLNPAFSSWKSSWAIHVNAEGVCFFMQFSDGGTAFEGIFRYTPGSLGFQARPDVFDPDLNARSQSGQSQILEDQQKNHWMIVDDLGLFKLNDSGDWTWFNHKNSGFPAIGVQNMAIDAFQNIWMATWGGLVVFNENGIKKLGFGPSGPIQKTEKVVVSPSPATDQIFVDLPENWGYAPVEWQIFNAKGAAVFAQKPIGSSGKAFSVGDFESGFYFIEARLGDWKAVGKFLKM